MKLPIRVKQTADRLKHLAFALAVGAATFFGAASSAHAALTWNLAGGGNWDTATANWTGDATTFTDNGTADVIFNKAGGGTITISAGMSPRSTTVDSSGDYTFSGGSIDSGSLTKSGTGKLTIFSANTNTGNTVINKGTLYVRSDSGATLGANPINVTVASGATLAGERSNFTGTLTLNGGTWSEGNGFGGSWTGPVTLGADSVIISGYGDLAINGIVSGPGSLTHNNTANQNKALNLNGINTYTGNTIIINKTVLKLGASGSINTTPLISIGANATFDVSAKSSPYLWSSTTTLSAAGAATAANLKGPSGGTVSLGSQPINLTFTPTSFSGDTTRPSLTVSQGALTLNNNPISVTNAAATALGSGSYTLVSVTGGTINQNATPSYPVTVTGTGLASGQVGSVAVSGGSLILTVASPSLAVTGFPASPTAGAAGSVTVTAKAGAATVANYTGTVHFTSTDAAAILPANYTFVSGDNGVHTFTNGVTLKTVGTQSITATDTVTGVTTGTQSGISVTPASAATLIVSGFPSPRQVGAAGSVTIAAKDAYGNAATGYTGTVHFSSSDGAAALPLNYTFQAGDNGTKTFSVTLNTAGLQSITATDTVTETITGTQSGINVVAGDYLSALLVSGFPSSSSAGATGSVTITAKDQNNATFTGFTGTVHFTSTDGAAVLPLDYTFVSGDNGVHTFTGGVTLKTVGIQSITATDSVASITGTQSGISVTPAGPATLMVSGFPNPQFVGTAGSVTVAAKDAFGNTVTGYTGTIQFTSTDGAAVLPSNFTFSGGDNGVHVFTGGVTFNTMGTQSITATDTVTGTITGTQSGITVNQVPVNFTWLNAMSGPWSNAANWSNNAGLIQAPFAAGQANYVLNFNQAGSYTTTHDLIAGFLINQLNFGGSSVTLAGNRMAFTANGATLPQINQNGSSGVTISAPLSMASDLTMGGSGSGAVTFSGVLSGGGKLTKSNPGQLTLTAANTNTGGTLISAGTLSVRGDLGGTLGAAGSVNLTIQSGATLQGERTNFAGTLIMNGGTWADGNGFGGSWTGPITLAVTSTVSPGYGQSFNGIVTGPGGLNKTGAGQFILSASNDFTGPITVPSGTLNAVSLNRVSGGMATSALGAPVTVPNGTLAFGSGGSTGTLVYTGPGETTDRVIKLAGTTGGATFTQAGTQRGVSTSRGDSGVLKFTSDFSIPGTAAADNRKTLTLTIVTGPDNGTNPGRGEISGSIGDSLAGTAGQLATSVTKAGPGTWTLSGANTYSGATKVQAGTLGFARADALGGGALDITSGAKVQLDYIGTRQITALSFDAGPAQVNGTYGSSDSIATHKDDSRFTGLGMVTVGPPISPTTTTLALTGGSEPSNGGATLTFTATVTGTAPSGSVRFYDGLTLIGSATLNGSYQAGLTTSELAGGVHVVTAQYVGDGSVAPSASAPLTHTIIETRVATSVTMASGNNPSNHGAAVTFTASVTGTSPTGTVRFYNDTALLGSALLNGSGQANLTTTGLAVGWRPITVRYVGDATNAPAASTPALFQTVLPPVGNGKVKVFILAGQSNMVAHSWVETGRDPNNSANTSFVGGLGSLRNMLNREPNKYGYLAVPAKPTPGGNPGWMTRSDVDVAYWGESNGLNRKGILDADFGDNGGVGSIGPEYGFGLVVGSQLGDQVLLIKYAFGGKSLKVDFRPPSSGGAVGPYYTGMIARTREVLMNLATYVPGYSGQGYEISGFGWHQGWNDQGQAVAEYETNLVNLIKDVRTEFEVPNMPVSIANTGMANSYCGTILQAQLNVGNPALHPEFSGTVATVDTRPFDFGTMQSASSDATHWNHNAESYFLVGESMGKAMMSMLPTAPPAPSYSSWASDPAQGLTAGVNDGPLDDPDHDGFSNLLEFTLGGAPMVASQANRPTIAKFGGTWNFEYDRSDLSLAPATTQVVEYGSDLIGWTPVTIPTTSAGIVTITPGSPSDHVQVAIPAAGGRIFARLKVSQ